MSIDSTSSDYSFIGCLCHLLFLLVNEHHEVLVWIVILYVAYKPADAVLLREKNTVSWLISMADTIKRTGCWYQLGAVLIVYSFHIYLV